MSRISRRQFSTFSLLFLLAAADAFAVQKGMLKPGPERLGAVEKKYREAGSLDADFVQEIYQAALARTKTSKGSLRLMKPNLMRWEIYEPEPSLMVSNGRKLWYYNPKAGKKGQVIERSAANLKQQPLFLILTGQSAITDSYEIEKTEEIQGIVKGKALTKFTLKPKKADSELVHVILTVQPSSLISELILENQGGNTTKISLQKQTLGDKLPAALFNFKPPQEAEIIK